MSEVRSPSGVPAWHEGLPPVSVSLAVDATTQHEIRWEAGALTLMAHPDAAAEAALAALGGERCPCLDVFDAWTAQTEQPDVLAIAPRFPGEIVRADRTALGRLEREASRWRAQWQAASEDLRVAGDSAGVVRLRRVAEPAERRARLRLGFVRILALDDALQHRLVCTVLAAAIDRWGDDRFRAANEARLAAALTGRAGPALAEAGIVAAASRPAVDLLAPGSRAVIDPPRQIALPLDWLSNVWARGVAVAGGEFVVAVTSVQDGGKVLTVRGVDDTVRIVSAPEKHR